MVAAVLIAVAVGFVLVRTAHRGYRSAHGNRVVHYTLHSRLLDRDLAEAAIVPAGGGRRPLLVLLHGRHDPSRLAWLIPDMSGPDTMLNDPLLAAVAALGRRAPVVVLLNGDAHSYFHDRRDGKWGSMLLREAIPDAVRRFGTLRGRVAIGGISMGGYGALLAGGTRRFCAVGGHSAALWQSGGASAPGAFDDAQDYAAHDIFARTRRYAGRRVWLDVGTDDPFRAADTAFAAALRRAGARVAFHVWPGGHEGAYWHRHMAAYLRFYAGALERCA